MKRTTVFVLAAFLLASCAGATPTPPIPKKIKIVEMSPDKTNDGLVITGIVENLGESIVPLVKISCRAYTPEGKEAASGWTYAVPNDLGPGDRATFAISLKTLRPISKYRCLPYIVSD